MAHRFDDQQQRQQLLTLVDRGTPEQLFVSEELMMRMKMNLFFGFEDFFTRISSKTFSKFG
jgi:hypothetical protein